VVNALILQAERVCQHRGTRLTALRQQVLLLLAKQKGAVGAYDLLEKFKEQDPSAKPATIYRALDFLSKNGLVHRIESINSFILCHHVGDCHHPVQLLICDQCGWVEEMQSTLVAQTIAEQAQKLQFQVQHQIIEAHGTCENCQ
jgi:Fur family zinc uptake transcriptional regulator